MTVQEILVENKKRLALRTAHYNPATGIGAIGERFPLDLRGSSIPTLYLPISMKQSPLIAALSSGEETLDSLAEKLNSSTSTILKAILTLRLKHDFEFWAISYAKIKPKRGGADIPFLLNRPQRKLVADFERQRLADMPIRVILLKARQWGGSTVTQIYMAWIQLVHRTGWNSTIAAHVKSTSRTIKGMYSNLIKSYPPELLNTDKQLQFRPFEGSHSVYIINERNNKVVIGTAEAPDSVRGEDVSMAHCSEVAMWKKTDGKTPEQIIKSVCDGILDEPMTIKVLESTANGTGNYFHHEWVRAKNGDSEMSPVFVAWFEIELYEKTVDEPRMFAKSLSEYEKWLFDKGATLENIAWYRRKSLSHSDQANIQSEFPSDDIEAFRHSGHDTFNIHKVAELEKSCLQPTAIGELRANALKGKESLRQIAFSQDDNGKLKIWEFPADEHFSNRYIVIVDTGGRSKNADFSVILVLDRYWLSEGGCEEVVAQWRGHIDHDLLVWKAAQIAKFYHNALLVIESNTHETEFTEGDHSEYILEQIANHYNNLYYRAEGDRIKENVPIRWGFHTNVKTKTAIVNHMIAVVRDTLYVERDKDAIHELSTYETKQNGSYGAKDGFHDDILITRMIGLYISNTLPIPKQITPSKLTTIQIINEASF